MEILSMSADLRRGLPSKIHIREKFSWCRNSGRIQPREISRIISACCLSGCFRYECG
jgi:hypothetical protein